MFELLAFAANVNQFGLPLMGMIALLASKVSHGRGRDVADRTLLSVLVLMVVMTFHAMIFEDRYWMFHAITLGVVIVGAVWEPKGS